MEAEGGGACGRAGPSYVACHTHVARRRLGSARLVSACRRSGSACVRLQLKEERVREAELEKRFFGYAKGWWKEYLAIRPVRQTMRSTGALVRIIRTLIRIIRTLSALFVPSSALFVPVSAFFVPFIHIVSSHPSHAAAPGGPPARPGCTPLTRRDALSPYTGSLPCQAPTRQLGPCCLTGRRTALSHP